MSSCRSAPVLPFAPAVALPLPLEVQRFRPGHFIDSIGRHGHDFNEIVLFESAGDLHRVGDVESCSQVGTIDAMSDDQTHQLQLSPDASGWMIIFPNAMLERSGLRLERLAWFARRSSGAGGRAVVSTSRRRRLHRSLATIESLQETNAMASGERDDAKAIGALFATVLGDLEAAHDMTLPYHAPYRHLERLLETVEERYRERVSLAELADAAGLSRAYLTTDLRAKTGRTAMDWLFERRLREARRQLVRSQISITQLAFELGFEDSSHFARRFRAAHGESPSRWRASRSRG